MSQALHNSEDKAEGSQCFTQARALAYSLEASDSCLAMRAFTAQRPQETTRVSTLTRLST